MKPFRLTLGLLACLLLAAQETPPAAPAKTTGRVEGRVINAASGDPMRNVEVTIRRSFSNDPNNVAVATETDARGHFAIGDLEPGDYDLAAAREGFMVRPASPAAATTVPVKVEAGQAVKDLTVPLMPLGVISGRVTDEDGDPVRGARVQAMQYGYANGKRQLNNRNNAAVANDKGEFRLWGLRPGTFYVQADRGNAMTFSQAETIRGPRPAGYLPTYHPNATDPAQASPIEVVLGAQLRGIDIHMRHDRTFVIRAKMGGNDSSENMMMLQLLPRDGNGAGPFGMRNRDGMIQFSGVRPGSYMIRGLLMDGEKHLYVSQPVDVSNEDVDAGTLTSAPGMDVAGAVHIEGPKSAPQDLHVNLAHNGPMLFGAPSADVKADGSFVLHDVVPDTYLVNVGSAGTYIKSIKVGGQASAGREIDLTGNTGPLDVTLGADVGKLEGTVHKPDGAPAGRVFVLAFLEGDRFGPGFRAVRSNDKGDYKFVNLQPGEYKLFAFEGVDPVAAFDPEFVKPFEKKAVRITIAPNAQAKADVTQIAAAKPTASDLQ